MPSKKKRYTFTHEGQRYNVFANSDKEAGQLISTRRAELEERRRIASGDMPLRIWADQCIDAYKTNMRPSTLHNFKGTVSSAILSEIGDLRLKTITPIDCQACLNLQSCKSRSYINAVYQAMRFLFRYAVLNNKIAADPTENLVRPQGTKKKRRALTPEERQRVLDAAPKKRTNWIYLLEMLCGCRPSEAASAKIDDISEVMGMDGRKYHLLHIRGTKTECADRQVPLPEELYALIKDIPPGEYISRTRQGTQHGQNWTRHWKAFRQEADLPDDLVPYCLRHEFGTECARRGVDIRITMKLMGHSTIRMTSEIYTNLVQNDMLTAAGLLSSVYSNVHPTRQPVGNADVLQG